MNHYWEESGTEGGTIVVCSLCRSEVFIPSSVSGVERTVILTAFLTQKPPRSNRELRPGRWVKDLLRPITVDCAGGSQ